MPSEDLIKEAKDWLASNTNLNMYNQHYRLIRLLMEAAEQDSIRRWKQEVTSN